MKLLQKISRLLKRRKHPLGKEATHLEKGRYGEWLAQTFCRKELKYRIITCNWRCGHDEVDLICRDGKVLVFIEVRTRKSGARTQGVQSVDKRKLRKLRRACRNYLFRLENPAPHFRFDIIDIALTKKRRRKNSPFRKCSPFLKAL